MRAYYNEFDPKTAAWLRELIREGLITSGDVDERDIREVSPTDLHGYDRVHFFAGIGGWDYALDLAGWPDDQPVWTGSCPCQPFSSAGKKKAQKDDRHLWPAFFRLIRECRPHVVFGEQVEGAIRHGWLDGLQTDLEAEGYAVGNCVLGAHSAGADHIRQRLYWMADSGHAQQRNVQRSGQSDDANSQRQASEFTRCGGVTVGLGESNCTGSYSRRIASSFDRYGCPIESDGSESVRVVHPDGAGSQGRSERRNGSGEWSTWEASMVIECRDGKRRRIPTKPAFFPLADGVPARVVRLRGYGNAIVPQVATSFIQAYLEAKS